MKTQIDYILINANWKYSALNCEAYNTFFAVGSDHRILTTKLRLSLRQSKSSTVKKVRYNWSKLLTGSNIKELYTVEVSNRFQAFLDLEEDVNSSNTINNNIISAHDETAKNHIPVKNKVKQHVLWVTNDIAEKGKAVFEALDYSNWVKTRSSAKNLHNTRIKLEEANVKEQERYAQGKVDEIKSPAEHQKSKLVWKTVNEFTGRKGTNKSKIKAKNQKGRIIKWKNHSQNLLGQPPIIKSKPARTVFQHALSTNTSNFKMGELKKCNIGFKNNKALGLVVAAKIYNMLLLDRIRPYLDQFLRINQKGFCPGRSPLAQIVTLKRLIEGVKAKQLHAVIIQKSIRLHSQRKTSGNSVWLWSAKENSRRNKHTLQRHCGTSDYTRW